MTTNNTSSSEPERTHPIPDGAPVLYEDLFITVYGKPDHYGGDPLYLEHTGGRDDLGPIMIREHNDLHGVIKQFVESETDK